MSQQIILNATKRDDLGKGASRRLRRTGYVPAILYGGKREPLSLTLEQREIQKEMKVEGFYSQILTLALDGSKQKFIIKAMQRHPYKPLVLHMDLERVSDDKELTVQIPLHFINEDSAKAVKQNGGVVSHHLLNIEISCLPSDLPEFIKVDLADVELDQTVHLSDLKLPKGVTCVALSHDDNKAVVSIHLPKAVVEEDSSPSAEADTSGEDKE